MDASSSAFGSSLGFDSPDFNLDLNAGLDLALDWDLDFGFGISETDYFYLKTNTDGSDELSVSLDARLNNGTAGETFTGSGSLFFFDLTAEDAAVDRSGVSASFAIDFDGDDSGRLTGREVLANCVRRSVCLITARV